MLNKDECKEEECKKWPTVQVCAWCGAKHSHEDLNTAIDDCNLCDSCYESYTNDLFHGVDTWVMKQC